MTRSGRHPDSCRDCGRPLATRGGAPPPPGSALHQARGLCGRDHERRRRAGTLDEIARLTHHTTADAEDVAWLLASGVTDRSTIAARLHRQWPTIERGLHRTGRHDLVARTTR